jgi:Na+-driven multidrug efflux pump
LPALGFNGAAYASIIAEGTGLMVIYFVIQLKGIHKSLAFFESVSFDASLTRLILIQSSPLIVQYAISIMSWEYFYILIEHHGSRALAISNTMRNIFGLFGVFSWAFASTANTMVSNIIGQGRQSEVVPLIHKISKASFLLSLFIFVLLNMKPEWFLLFYGQGELFIREAVPVVRVVSVALLMMSFSMKKMHNRNRKYSC